MPFRENDEATRARVEALAEKVEELEKERDQLLREKQLRDAQVTTPPVSARPEPEPVTRRGLSPNAPNATREPEPELDASPPSVKVEPTAIRAAALVGKLAWVIVPVVFIGIAAAISITRDRAQAQARAEYEAKLAVRNAMTKEWNAVITVEPCVRAAELNAHYARDLATRSMDANARPADTTALTGAHVRCTDGAKALVSLASTPLPTKNALKKWLSTEGEIASIVDGISTYYRARDYQDDNFARAPDMWKRLLSAMDRRQAALGDVRTIALPITREMIRARQEAEDAAHSHTDLWWRVEIGLAMWDIEEIAFRVSGISAGKKPDLSAAATAMHDPLASLLEHAKLAPIEVRRNFRDDATLSSVLAGQLTIDVLFRIENNYDLMTSLDSHVPGRPPFPDKPPR